MPLSYRAAQSLIKRGNEAGLRAALSEGLDPNLANENGWTLLMLTAVEGHTTLARLLLEHGADPTRQNSKGETAATIAANRGNTELASLFTA